MSLNTTSLPLIMVLTYFVGEIYKLIFIKVKNAYKFLPVISMIGGVGFAIAIFYTNKSLMFNVDNVRDAIMIGIVSGGGSTGANQVIKQIVSKPIKEAKSEGYNEALQEMSIIENELAKDEIDENNNNNKNNNNDSSSNNNSQF